MNRGRVYITASLLFLGTVLGCHAVLAQDDGLMCDLDKVLSDWKARQQRARNVRYVLIGEASVPRDKQLSLARGDDFDLPHGATVKRQRVVLLLSAPTR